jgi:hypothetical protein
VGHAQHLVIVRAHKFIESARVATLSGANKIDLGGTLRAGHGY